MGASVWLVSPVPATTQVLAVLLCPFYLGGGTALALRLGHRISQDLDLFANIESLDDDFRHSIIEELRQGHMVTVLQDSVFGLVLEANGQAISFFSYGYPMLEPTDLVSGVQIAGLLDIGLMKMDAIAGRSTRRDFYDLYFIASRVSLDELFAQSTEKYPYSHGFKMRVLVALVDFDAADQDEEPRLLLPVEWGAVKAFFTTEARRLGREWLGLADPGGKDTK
jgi:hypothetical protein